MSKSSQLLRYAFVGVLTNAAGYLVYLILTYLGSTPKTTMSFLYGVGAAAGFFGHRWLSFSHKGSILGAVIRYLAAQFLGYFVNFFMLVFFADHLGIQHQYVQAAAVFVVAAVLFVTFKYFVFPDSGPGRRGAAA